MTKKGTIVFKISQRIFITQPDFFARIYSKVSSFLGEYFRSVQALTTLIFMLFFTFRWHYKISTSYTRYLFHPQSLFVIQQLKITYCSHFLTLNFRQKKFRFEKKTTFKWVYRPQNIILHHFFICSKHPLLSYVHISKKYFGFKICSIWISEISKNEKNTKYFETKIFFWDTDILYYGVFRTCKKVM